LILGFLCYYTKKSACFIEPKHEIIGHWVLKLDADERITPAASIEILTLCSRHFSDSINGIYLPFEVNFLGRKLHHGGIYPFRKLVVFKAGMVDVEEKLQDEHLFLLSGSSIRSKEICLHNDKKTLTEWLSKHNNYSSLECEQVSENPLASDTTFKGRIKNSFYYRLPSFFRAKLYYFYRLFIRFAWLDGRPGLVYAFLQAYAYRYIVDAKLWEKKHSKNK
jgi:hypothetical protein